MRKTIRLIVLVVLLVSVLLILFAKNDTINKVCWVLMYIGALVLFAVREKNKKEESAEEFDRKRKQRAAELAAQNKPGSEGGKAPEAKPEARSEAKPERKTEKSIISDNGDNIFVTLAAGSYEEIYRQWIENAAKMEVTINALLKSEAADEYTLVDKGGRYADYLAKEIRKKYELAESSGVSVPKVINVPELDQKTIDNWCKTKNGETDERIVWLTDKHDHCRCYRLLRVQAGDQRDLSFSMIKDMEKYGLTKAVKAKWQNHDLIHDPWHPVYPDLSGLILRQLQTDGDEREYTTGIEEAELDKITAAFFGNNTDKSIELKETDGVTIEEAQKNAIRRMIEFGMRWSDGRRSRIWRNAPIEYSFGCFRRRWEREVPCWDGGNCGTDTEIDEVKFELYDKDTDRWDGLVRSKTLEHGNKETETLLQKWREAWGYSGRSAEEATPFIISRDRRLFLLDPFGMKGIYVFKH